jgi:hypothetical protein
MVMAILLLDHPFVPHARLPHLNRPMIVVSYSFIQLVSLSSVKKSNCRFSSSNRRETSSCNAGNIDHGRASGFDFLDGITGMVRRESEELKGRLMDRYVGFRRLKKEVDYY